MRKIILSIGYLLTLTACSDQVMLRLGKPYPLNLQPPPGTPEYQQGWKDGCSSALSGYGTQFNKVFFDFQQDTTQILEPVYRQIWHDAYDYCRTYVKTANLHGFNNFDKSGIEF